MHQQSTPTNKAFQQTQLNFNIDGYMASKSSNYQKPRPIVIEKLLPYPTTIPVQIGELLNVNPKLSSEKLETAMQLAKLDIKRLKSMLRNEEKGTVSVDKDIKELAVNRCGNVKSKMKKATGVTEEPKRTKRYEKQMYPDAIINNNINSSYIERKKVRNTQVERKQQDFPGEQKELKDLKLLQQDLEKYTRSLQQVVDQMSRHNSSSGNKVSEEEAEDKKRKVHRADEQIIRSARMLYVLQRKVNDLENNPNKKKHDIKQTKKSYYLKSVSSAHRAAVRTLQMFMNHAPLYYDTSGRLPPIYTELGLLIQQLTQLSMDVSTNNHSNHSFVEELVSSLKELERRKKYSPARKMEQQSAKLPPTKKEFLDSHDVWIKQKVGNLRIQSEQDNYTPERIATLKHAHEAISDGVDRGQKGKPSTKKSITEGRLKSSKSLLKNYSKTRTTRPASVYSRKRPSTFAAPTVASRIREKPPVEKQAKVTPPLTPKKSVAFDVDFRTSKERDEDIILEARLNNSLTESPTNDHKRSPRRSGNRSLIYSRPRSSTPPLSTVTSPRYYNEQKASSPTTYAQRALSPTYYAEKEISRQHWLDRVKARELRKLDMMRKTNSHEFSQLRKDFEVSKHLVTQAERKICERLKPLLDRAELIAQEDEKRSEAYNTSVKKRLADVASQQALSEGERLAEYILDDLLIEAALDLSFIDTERCAEFEAAFQYDRPTLESIEERLLTFEKEEDSIRRNRQTIDYSETKLCGGDSFGYSDTQEPRQSAIIRFTKSKGKLPELPTVSRHSDVVESSKNLSPFIDVSSGMFHNIVAQKDKFDNFLKKSSLTTGTFDAWMLVSNLSEEILDELLGQVTGELNDTCNRFVEDVYEEEFVQPKP